MTNNTTRIAEHKIEGRTIYRLMTDGRIYTRDLGCSDWREMHEWPEFVEERFAR